jgi:hypothetical protein
VKCEAEGSAKVALPPNLLDKADRRRQFPASPPHRFSLEGNPFHQGVIKNKYTKMKKLFFTLSVLALVTAVPVQAATIERTMANINADANKPGGPEQVLKSISASTGVPVATLEKQKAKTGMSYGDLFAAHSIAKAAGKKFDEIAALKAKGESWDKIAEANNVSLGGKKANKQAEVKPVAKPSPTPQKTLAEEQRERWSQPHVITNAPKKQKTP